MQRASYRRNFTPAQPDSPATSLRDFVSGAYKPRDCLEYIVLHEMVHLLGNCSPPLSAENAFPVNEIAFPMNKAAGVT